MQFVGLAGRDLTAVHKKKDDSLAVGNKVGHSSRWRFTRTVGTGRSNQTKQHGPKDRPQVCQVVQVTKNRPIPMKNTTGLETWQPHEDLVTSWQHLRMRCVRHALQMGQSI